MTIRETEHVTGVNSGMTFCHSCYPGGGGETLLSIHHGYGVTPPLDKDELNQLQDTAKAHDKTNPDHNIEIIVYKRK